MVARVGLLLRALPLLLWDRLDAQPAEREGQELRKEAEAFLEKYGYLNEQVPKAPTSTRFSDAIRAFQWVSQLPVSGVLDRATLRQMTRPRCGVADTNSYAAWAERISDLFARHRTKMRRKKRFAKQGNKWYKQHLSYRLVNWPERLPEPAVRGAVRAAFQLWSNVSALEFWEAPATGPADIRLTFFQGDHNDGLGNAFDGPGADTKPPSHTAGGEPNLERQFGGGNEVFTLPVALAEPHLPAKNPQSSHPGMGTVVPALLCVTCLNGQSDEALQEKCFANSEEY